MLKIKVHKDFQDTKEDVLSQKTGKKNAPQLWDQKEKVLRIYNCLFSLGAENVSSILKIDFKYD